MESLLESAFHILFALVGIGTAWIIGYLLMKRMQAERAMLWAIVAGRATMIISDWLEKLILQLENAKITFIVNLVLVLVLVILTLISVLKSHQE